MPQQITKPYKTQDIPLDVQVDELHLDIEDHHGVDLTSFEEPKQKQLQDETSRDPTLKVLWRTVIDGWPDTIQELPASMQKFLAIQRWDRHIKRCPVQGKTSHCTQDTPRGTSRASYTKATWG